MLTAMYTYGTASVRIAVNFGRIFLSGAPLLKLPSQKAPPPDPSTTFLPDPQRLAATIPHLHTALEHILTLSASDVNSFTIVGWGSVILAIILGFRMSFPIPNCPGWDDKAARAQIRFGDYLNRLCKMGDSADSAESNKTDEDVFANLTPATYPKSMDILSASKVVFRVVRRKFQKRAAKLDPPPPVPPPPQSGAATAAAATSSATASSFSSALASAMAAAAAHIHPGLDIASALQSAMQQQQQQQVQHAHQLDTSMVGCPMIDGSLESFYPYWDETFPAHLMSSHHLEMAGQQQQQLHQHLQQQQQQQHQQQQHQHQHQQQPQKPNPAGGGGGGTVISVVEDSGDQTTPVAGGDGASPGEGYGADLWGAMTVNWAQAQANMMSYNNIQGM